MSRRETRIRGSLLTQEWFPRFTGSEPCSGLEDKYLHEEPRHQDRGEVVEMRELCASCPLLEQCRTWAVAHEGFGFWAGMTAKDRDAERKRRNQWLVEPSQTMLNGNHHRARPNQCSKGHYVSTRDVSYRIASDGSEKVHVDCDTCREEAQERMYSPDAMRAKAFKRHEQKRSSKSRHIWDRQQLGAA